MEIDLNQQKETFLSCCRDNISREGLDSLLEWLEKSDFFRAPASTRFHGAYPGGLCEHSLDVFSYAKQMRDALSLPLKTEALAVSALFHDVCKVNFYKEDTRNQKINGTWQAVPYYAVEEKFAFGGHGSKSVFLIERFMRLSLEEAVAINCHMGFSEGGNAVQTIGRSYEQYPLAWLIHVADEASIYLLKR
ncbi:MAG: HD domain-containing protein [Clostridia bacterium]|nr:HD domain-containing protein [Clostridia bacterium]